MNNLLLTNWIDNLYQQTTFNPHYLRSEQPHRMCPLGLLCQLSNMGQWEYIEKDFLPPTDKTIDTYVINDTERTVSSPRGTTILPLNVQRELNLPNSVGGFTLAMTPQWVQDTINAKLASYAERWTIAALPVICFPTETTAIIEALFRPSEQMRAFYEPVD